MSIQMVKCRARVYIGNISVETPYVQSFNVRKQRGQVGTFDASLKVAGDVIGGGLTGGPVQIYAGSGSPSKLIFTGICRQAKLSPCYDDPAYVILSISGADVLSLLQGKKYTRRCRSSKSAWVGITGVVREGLRSGKFAYANEPTLFIDGGKLERNNNVMAHVGTSASVSETVKTRNAPTGETLSSAQIVATILNNSPVIPEGQ